jgi:hypothetical protein
MKASGNSGGLMPRAPPTRSQFVTLILMISATAMVAIEK